MKRSASSVVIRYHGYWLDKTGVFLATTTLEESRGFNTIEDAEKWIADSWSTSPRDFHIMYYAVALSEEDQVYAQQLEELRS
jgi:hypothetical protein